MKKVASFGTLDLKNWKSKMTFIQRVGRIILDLVVVTAILLLVPGLPPYLKFESYRY